MGGDVRNNLCRIVLSGMVVNGGVEASFFLKALVWGGAGCSAMWSKAIREVNDMCEIYLYDVGARHEGIVKKRSKYA